MRTWSAGAEVKATGEARAGAKGRVAGRGERQNEQCGEATVPSGEVERRKGTGQEGGSRSEDSWALGKRAEEGGGGGNGGQKQGAGTEGRGKTEREKQQMVRRKKDGG